jgi:Ankyrin repeats (3 copies)
MIYRLKFRVHGGSHAGKFVYNVRNGATLYLNESFRPSGGGPELAHYCVMVRNGSSTIAVLKAGATWNNQSGGKSPSPLRAGNLLSANGIVVEVLECPATVVADDREVTKFLDLEALERQAAIAAGQSVAPPLGGHFRDEGVEIVTDQVRMTPSPHYTVGHASAPYEPTEARRPVAATPVPFHPEASTDAPDRIVVPLSLDPAPAKVDEIKPASPRVDAPKFTPIPNVDPMKARETTLKRAAAVAVTFAILIYGANRAAQNYQLFELPDDESNNNFSVTLHAVKRPAVLAAPVAQGRVPASNTPQAVLPLPMQPEPPPGPKKPSPEQIKELTQAIEDGKLPLVIHFVDSGISPDFALDELGRSPFVRAAAAGRVTVMQYLLTKNVTVTATDFTGTNALMWATINGHEKTVRFLLSLGLDPATKRDDGKDCFRLARDYRQNGVLNALKQYAKAKPTKSADDRKPASRK